MYVGTLLLSSIFVILDKLPVGSILASSQLMVYITSPLMNFSNTISQIKSSKDICDKLNNILEVEEERAVVDDNSDIFEFNKEIVFKNINFKSNNKSILSNLNFTIEKNKKYIFIGDSGSGKSSIINALLSTIDYTGDILIDGINTRDINQADIYKNISISKQSPYLFYDSIYNNISLDNSYTSKEISDVISNLRLNKLIQDNQDIIDGEAIKNFSGGEKQRIALARSLLKKSPILLLDECTSQLDNDTALQVEDYILSLKEKTIIMVLHRLNKSILEKADYVVIVKDGEIIECASYSNITDTSILPI